MEESRDKQWAKAYILDPLTAPEPNQETGIGASHNLSAQLRNISLENSSPSPSQDRSEDRKHKHRSSSHSHRHRSYPTPPTSASPTRSDFHPSNPFSDSAASRRAHSSKSLSPPNSPPADSRRYPPNSAVTRSSSARVPQQSSLRPPPVHHRSFSAGNCDISRKPSLNQRFPGDMSHRPLEILRKEARAADRAPHLRRKQLPVTDTIDALDTIGGTYHHGGPYDATLASRNRNKLYSPVAAVQDSNNEAIRATPREYIEDSLRRHIPLQGTATIPSGEQDFRGDTIEYEEGADLMREPDAVGGAYKRWDGIKYHPDDLKGKGEPSYTYEKDLKEKKRLRRGEPVEYELSSGMKSSKRPPFSHHRSFSESPRSAPSQDGASDGNGLRRNNSTGRHRLSDGLRRRFGSIRRKKVDEVR
ncbi:hypothetical protein NCS57_00176300 [Fusarium keratoplasticum]|uniref:Uncharacterized protein n=1 Tax=Fusarium keratoplasticum TaxID=1328300 RepID=A0ACC0RIQ5_9HYPO|nr:hypothetical protein NCS57_00176300 [Fusarium keratoplasticum]KAI8685083.1 hypothetical protein NCS57_00176300 [Fusarium keratoplasticum]KAI8689202.1 hypothetical protein NCS55_00176700 [Fusarium keratoplasticum]